MMILMLYRKSQEIAWSNVSSYYSLYDEIFNDFVHNKNIDSWEYKGSYLEEIFDSEPLYTSYRVYKSFCLKENDFSLFLKLLEDKLQILIQDVLSKPIIYDEDEPETWEENFIKIEYKNKEIAFSHESENGQIIWGLFNSLKSIEKEINLNGSLCIAYASDKPVSQT